MFKAYSPVFNTDCLGDKENIGWNNGNYLIEEQVLFDPKTKELAIWSNVRSDFYEPEITTIMRHSSLRHVHMLCKKLAREEYEFYNS